MAEKYAEITVPNQGLTVESVHVSKWLKSVGESVTAGEPLLVILSDKADLEVESPASGVLSEIRVATDEEAAIGAVLGLVQVKEET